MLVQGFRYFNVYGPMEEHKGNQMSPVSKFIQQAKDNGIIKIFEGSDKFSRDLANGINTLVKDEKRRESMAKKGRQRVEDYFDWEAIAKQTLTIYKALI